MKELSIREVPKKFQGLPYKDPEAFAKNPNNRSRYLDFGALAKQLAKEKKRFFNMEAIGNFGLIGKAIKERCGLNIINLPKQVGKSTGLITQGNTHTLREIQRIKTNPEKDPHYFMLVYRSDTHAKNMIREMNMSDKYLFKHKAGQLVTKGTGETRTKENGEEESILVDANIPVGYLLPGSTIHQNSSKFWDYFYDVYFDEYMPKKKLPAEQAKEDFAVFLQFVSNVQRNKSGENLKFYLFGNNESGADNIGEMLRIYKEMHYNIDLEKGIFYMNDFEVFPGVEEENNIAKGIAEEFDDETYEYLSFNKARKTSSRILTQEFNAASILVHYIVFDKVFYMLRMDMQGVGCINKISELRGKNRTDDKPTVAYQVSDYLYDPSIRLLNPKRLKGLAIKYKKLTLGFQQSSAEELFAPIFDKLLPIETFRK